jgi:malate dehydrogenase (oxaloacetate-decarboxylating)
VFALSNPDPEVHPDVAARYAAIVATGRSDFPNQINNVLAFPGIFRGALDVHARAISSGMRLAAAEALAAVIGADEINEEYIVPSVFNRQIVPQIAQAVAQAAVDEGLARHAPRNGSD